MPLRAGALLYNFIFKPDRVDRHAWHCNTCFYVLESKPAQLNRESSIAVYIIPVIKTEWHELHHLAYACNSNASVPEKFAGIRYFLLFFFFGTKISPTFS